MSDRRDATEQRDRPWERPHSHEADLMEADLRIDRWTLDVLRAIGQAVVVIADDIVTIHRTVDGIQKSQVILAKGNRKIMADLTALTAALAEVQASAETASAAVLAALAATSAQIADLKAQIDALTVGAVTQEQIDALTATATAADTIVDSITAAVTPAV